jgi:hypothetical protein
MGPYSGVSIATNRKGISYIDGLYGSEGVIATLKRLGFPQKEFGRINKIAATIVANNSRKRAPVLTGGLQRSIKAYASKKITQNNNPPKHLYGGVVVVDAKRRARRGERALINRGESAEIVGYGKRISFGMYRSPQKTSTGEPFRQQGNPYLRTARDKSRPAIVAMWNREITKWLQGQKIGEDRWIVTRYVKVFGSNWKGY